jgi:hypothetical protein
MRWLCLFVPLLLLGCRERVTLLEIVEAMNARQVSHCLYAQVAVAPYGSAYLYAKSGGLNCEEIWDRKRQLEMP